MVLIIISIPAFAAEEPSNRIISERMIATLPNTSSWIRETVKISPDYQHFAYALQVENKFVVVRDGIESRAYDGVGTPPLQGSIKFSPDSQHFAYIAREGEKWFVVQDGVEGKKYDDIHDSLVFSPDSKRLAFVAQQGDERFVVVDGVEHKKYEMIAMLSLHYSPDSRYVAYAARQNKKWFTVVNEKEGSHYWALYGLFISPDSKRVAAVGQNEAHKYFIEIDGNVINSYDRVGTNLYFFSPDGKRYIFIAEKAGKWMTVIDGKEGRLFDNIKHESLVFSPDGQHFAYIAVENGQEFVVVDEKLGPAYYEVKNLSYNPIGQSFFYIARKGINYCANLMMDNQIFDSNNVANVDWYYFSPDGKRIAYLVTVRKKTLMVDKTQFATYPYITAMSFSPDSKKIALIAGADGKYFSVYNNQEGKKFNMIISERTGFFDKADTFHYIGVLGNKLYYVEERIKE